MKLHFVGLALVTVGTVGAFTLGPTAYPTVNPGLWHLLWIFPAVATVLAIIVEKRERNEVGRS